MTSPVPSFYLYGEPHRIVADGFVHVEAIDDRSRPSEWTIRPHAHAELVQLFLVVGGGGTLIVEDRSLAFSPPCMLLMPATAVHGFSWEAESRGHVVTAAQAFVAELTRVDAALANLFRTPAVIALEHEDVGRAALIAGELARELGWAAPGHRAAVSSALLRLFVLALRSSEVPSSSTDVGRDAQLVARFRERVEQRFRLREPVEAHAKALGVSATTLRTSCARAASASPTALIDQRALLEARRALLYTRLSVAEVAFLVGFDDAAYFSRFFDRHVGEPPTAYRRRRTAG